MKKFVWAVMFLSLTVGLLAAPQRTQLQPGPGKKIVDTLFGQVEVDLSDPRPGIAFGPPLPGAPANPGAVPAAPAPAAGQAPLAGQAPAAAQGAGDQIIPISLHFDNQDLHQVVRIIGDQLGINYLIDPAVRGTVNINTAGNLRRSDLLPILEALLKMNGATMVQVGNFYQIVPANTAARMPLEVQTAQPAVAPDDQVVLQVVAMKFVAAEEMARLLTPYISEAGNITAQGSSLLITERRSNLRKLLEVIDLFDNAAFQGERVRILAAKNNKVKDIVDDLKSVFSGYALSTNSAIRFLPIERLNSVLVVTPDATVFPEVERWMERLDQPLQLAGVRNFVYRAKNKRAGDLQRVLTELYGGNSQPEISSNVITSTGATAANVTTPNINQIGNIPAPPVVLAPTGAPTAAPLEAGVGTLVSPGQLRIIADPGSNALVIQATPQDYQLILQTLEELDILPRQVLIDAQVYEVVLDESLTFGLSALLQNRTNADHATTAAFATGAAGSQASLSLSTFALIGRTRELLLFLNASENRSRVRTLSAPSLLVSDNSTAQVQIGAEIPIPGSSSFTPLGGTNQTILFRDTGVLLNVTPQINDGGNLTLRISQEVSRATANTTSAIVAPEIGKSSVNSTVVARNGETIALTGFIRENNQLVRNRIPLLGSIPVLGTLLGNTSRGNNRSELIVLITPHVITTPEEATAATDELKAKLKEIQKSIN